VKATIHWVSAAHAVDAEVRLYEPLFNCESPNDLADLNPKSLEVLTGCRTGTSAGEPEPEFRCQFERLGYFCAD